jgi:hypothetical protein
MGDSSVISVIHWAVGPGVRGCVDHSRFITSPSVLPSRLARRNRQMESPPWRVRPHQLPSRLYSSAGSLLYLQCVKACVGGLLDLNARNSLAAGFDFVIAISTVLGIRKMSARGSLASLLRRQGIEYFGLILMVHTVTVVSTDSFRCWGSHLTVSQALVFHDPNCTHRRHV